MLDDCANSSYEQCCTNARKTVEEIPKIQPICVFVSIEKSSHNGVVDEMNKLLLCDNIRDVDLVSLKYNRRVSLPYKAIVKVYYK